MLKMSRENREDKTEQEYIDEDVCPICKAELVFRMGCKGCLSCGFSIC